MVASLSACGGAAALAATETKEPHEGVASLPAVTVKSDRLDDFGFHVILEASARPHCPYVTDVLPNSAAAKAGLRPGDRILKSDGKSAAVTLFTIGKWYSTTGRGVTSEQTRRVEAAAESGQPNVVWTLEVESLGSKTPRMLTLSLPTPAPRWGAAKWQPPEGRAPATVPEPGPLAERCREVLDNGIWSSPCPGDGAPLLGAGKNPARYHFLGYCWSLEQSGVTHCIFVTQQRGPTQVLLSRYNESEMTIYLTSPAGVLEKAWRWPSQKKKNAGTEPFDGAREGFQQEMDFWLKQVRRGAGRWPFEILPDK